MSVLWPLFCVLGLLTLKMEAVRYSEAVIFISIMYSVYVVHILFGLRLVFGIISMRMALY